MHIHAAAHKHMVTTTWHRHIHTVKTRTHPPLAADVSISSQHAWLAHSQCRRQSGCSPVHDSEIHNLYHGAHYLTYKYNYVFIKQIHYHTLSRIHWRSRECHGFVRTLHQSNIQKYSNTWVLRKCMESGWIKRYRDVTISLCNGWGCGQAVTGRVCPVTTTDSCGSLFTHKMCVFTLHVKTVQSSDQKNGKCAMSWRWGCGRTVLMYS